MWRGGEGRERTPFLKLEEKDSEVAVEEEVEKRAPLAHNLETEALISFKHHQSACTRKRDRAV